MDPQRFQLATLILSWKFTILVLRLGRLQQGIWRSDVTCEESMNLNGLRSDSSCYYYLYIQYMYTAFSASDYLGTHFFRRRRQPPDASRDLYAYDQMVTHLSLYK